MRKKKELVGIHVPAANEGNGPSWVLIVIMLCLIPPVGALLVPVKIFKLWKKKKMADFREYAAIIGDRMRVSLNELCSKRGRTISLVISDLQSMISRGYMGSDAYIDREKNVLVVNARATESAEAPTVRIVVETPQREEKPAEAPKKEKISNDAFDDVLREIRRLNDEIDDAAVSQRIDRIEALTDGIFRLMREKPEQMDDVKKFMNYYLPTTLKLLRSYALMEKQSYQGENIVASRRKIEQILDTLIQAFEQQSDRLFSSEAMDVDTDIQVLETMMAKDGLTQTRRTNLRAKGL